MTDAVQTKSQTIRARTSDLLSSSGDPVGAVGGLAALHTDSKLFCDEFGPGEQLGDRAKWSRHEILIKSSHDYA